MRWWLQYAMLLSCLYLPAPASAADFAGGISLALQAMCQAQGCKQNEVSLTAAYFGFKTNKDCTSQPLA
ncbi:hypothetical protein J6590_045677 [Homalodisca vitripennis]|nr:hypothetical protein J6590_045677 [Homalodisca vitripennis]